MPGNDHTLRRVVLEYGDDDDDDDDGVEMATKMGERRRRKKGRQSNSLLLIRLGRSAVAGRLGVFPTGARDSPGRGAAHVVPRAEDGPNRRKKGSLSDWYIMIIITPWSMYAKALKGHIDHLPDIADQLSGSIHAKNQECSPLVTQCSMSLVMPVAYALSMT